MSATNATGDQTTAQPGAETGATVSVSVEEAAAHFGISPQAVRKRIAAGYLDAERVGRSWRVYLPAQPAQPNETATNERLRETTKPLETKPVAQSQREQFALMVEPIVAPWVAKVEELSREAERNRARAELAEERLAAAEQERDELRRLMEEALLFDPAEDDDAAMVDAAKSATIPESPQTHTMAPGRADPPDVSNESNESASSARRGGLAGWWDRVRGR